MGATTVRVSTRAHQQLKEIARADGVSLTEALNRIIEAQHRQRFLEGLAQDYVALREEEGAWQEEREERNTLEGTLMDGLEDNPYDFSGVAPEELEANPDEDPHE